MRARIDISEIESETKIRAKYLRALENEEWDLLPGPTYVKSFLRTYADALGLDSRLLLEEYKLRHERLCVEPESLRVGAQKALDERRAGQQPPLLVLERAQVLGPNLRLALDLGHVDASAHARFAQRLADLRHGA